MEKVFDGHAGEWSESAKALVTWIAHRKSATSHRTHDAVHLDLAQRISSSRHRDSAVHVGGLERLPHLSTIGGPFGTTHWNWQRWVTVLRCPSSGEHVTPMIDFSTSPFYASRLGWVGAVTDDFWDVLFLFLLLAPTCRSLVWTCLVDLRRKTPDNGRRDRQFPSCHAGSEVDHHRSRVKGPRAPA